MPGKRLLQITVGSEVVCAIEQGTLQGFCCGWVGLFRPGWEWHGCQLACLRWLRLCWLGTAPPPSCPVCPRMSATCLLLHPRSNNYRGQVGNGDFVPATSDEIIDEGILTKVRSPAPVAGGHQFAQLTAGNDHVCGLTVEGDAYCW